jgi:hypothetical protein
VDPPDPRPALLAQTDSRATVPSGVSMKKMKEITPMPKALLLFPWLSDNH